MLIACCFFIERKSDFHHIEIEFKFKMKEMNYIDIIFDNIWFNFWYKLNCSIYNYCDNNKEWCIIIISIEKFIELINKIIILLNKKYDEVIKKKCNFWYKLDIKEFKWFKNDIWKSNSANFLKSK